jgi:Fe-S oxidoreductase
VIANLPGVSLTEMDRIKEYAWCGGSCGGVTDSNPEFAEWTAEERLEEAASTGAEAIVSASPWSEKLFTEVIKKNGGRLKVYDVVQLVDQAI